MPAASRILLLLWRNSTTACICANSCHLGLLPTLLPCLRLQKLKAEIKSGGAKAAEYEQRIAELGAEIEVRGGRDNCFTRVLFIWHSGFPGAHFYDLWHLPATMGSGVCQWRVASMLAACAGGRTARLGCCPPSPSAAELAAPF